MPKRAKRQLKRKDLATSFLLLLAATADVAVVVEWYLFNMYIYILLLWSHPPRTLLASTVRYLFLKMSFSLRSGE